MPEQEVLKADEKSLFEFLKEYDVCPSLINKGVAFQLYLHTKNAHESAYEHAGLQILAGMAKSSGTTLRRQATTGSLQDWNQPKYVGKYFTFFKFLDLMVKCAKVTFSGFSSGSESQIYSNFKENKLMEGEMLCLLLERLELSRGFN